MIGRPIASGPLATAGFTVAANGLSCTDLWVQAVGAQGRRNGHFVVQINRILRPGEGSAAADDPGQPCLSATWRLADGTQGRGIFATARYVPEPAARS